MRRSTKVCTTPGCPEIVTASEPCPKHGRPLNASWSPQRDRKSHWKLRMQVIKARGARCERCGKPGEDARGKGIAMHHHGPQDLPEHVTLLCNDCHRAVDSHAR